MRSQIKSGRDGRFFCLLNLFDTSFGTRSSVGLKSNACSCDFIKRSQKQFYERSFTKRVFAIKLFGKPRSA
ncbi:hypothetical protein EOS_00100 [Caballeronia mineralivorans PML1(12)]|uniref:Uncharacterized protein n=1 Tax=Caballeronia mineralivorans PML1(12) TaxID=908627 RepID=A0A0J1D6F1_9BURK|nr:hypothetical protein EOS_00100 [Caballeronia mineralivorans PML1(12)]